MIWNYNKNGSALLTTVFVLFGILAISMIGIEIVLTGLLARRAQGSSVKAFYAAEAGIERSIAMFKEQYEAGTDTLYNCAKFGAYRYIDFDATGCSSNEQYFDINNNSVSRDAGNLPKYSVRLLLDNTVGKERVMHIYGRGRYGSTVRELHVSFCLPTCAGADSGDGDGCGGTCL